MHEFLVFAANSRGVFMVAALAALIYPLIVFKRIHDLRMLPQTENYLQDDAGISLAAGIIKHCGWPTAITVYGGVMMGVALMFTPMLALAFLG